MSVQRQGGGVWVARNADGSSIVPFASEIDALRHAVSFLMEVAWVPWGEEARDYKEPPQQPQQPVCRGEVAGGGDG